MSDTLFKIKIAGTVVEISSLYDCIHEFCLDYITDEDPVFTVNIKQDDIDFEREYEEKGPEGNGRIPEDYPDSYLEVLACYRKIAEEMITRDILLMHGSAVSIDGCGVMFIAGSGTGKSTHAGIWQRCFRERAVLVNDDKPLVKITDDEIFVCGTPWSGKKGLNTPVNVPLKCIYKLERTSDVIRDDGSPEVSIGNNKVYGISGDEMWKALASQSYKSADPLKLSYSMGLLDKIMQKIPVKRLVCDMTDDAAFAAYEGVFGGGIS